ncbi:hypothetical protein JOQ06_019108 [Pogonophryne albipinna]|uniref:Uncharacterized protein n=1 Tax=Pogonophryne albipinna TaxID=1090488 RepID=A0AAD6AQQ0_9TELE|nr:hypothetical protein JOQ06_019108 [Pogonophryne albipinna]
MSEIKLGSLNINGARGDAKRASLFTLLGNKSLNQWWDVGKVKIKQLCLQYTFNVTKDMARSLRALEREVVELQGLADSTGEREHVEGFKS